MEKLKIELFVYDTLVFGKILIQDEMDFTYNASSGMKITSNAHPELTETVLYVRGNVKSSSDVFIYRFPNNATAIEIANKIRDAVNEYNNTASSDASSKVIQVM